MPFGLKFPFSIVGQVQAWEREDAGIGDKVVRFNLADELRLGIGERSVNDVYQTPSDLVNLIVSNLMVIGGIVLFIMIIFAGFKFLQNTEKGVEDARKILTAAIVGFVLMFSAFWIVQIVQVITGADIRL